MVDNDALYRAVLDDRDRLLDIIRTRDARIAELERAISLRDQFITMEEGEDGNRR
jgi:hypothetical protein